MLTATEKSVILLGVLILMTPPLYAQNDLLLFGLPPLSEKETLSEPDITSPLPVFLKLTSPEIETGIKPAGSLLATVQQGLVNITDYDEFFMTTSLVPRFGLSQSSFHFVNFYKENDQDFWDLIEARVREDTRKKNEEKKIVREAWEEWLGLDIWYPYFKAKEIEDWLCDRFKLRIFRFRGRMKFENERLTYTFKMQF